MPGHAKEVAIDGEQLPVRMDRLRGNQAIAGARGNALGAAAVEDLRGGEVIPDFSKYQTKPSQQVVP